MAIRSRTFYAPYLADFSTDYKDNTFLIVTQVDDHGSYGEFSVETTINDSRVNELLSDGTLALVALVECPSTNFRVSHKFEQGSKNLVFQIDSGSVDGKTNICVYLIAEKNFVYQNPNVDPFFLGSEIAIEKGNKLGESNDTPEYFTHKQSKNGDSIFKFSPELSVPDSATPTIRYFNDCIDISMPKRMYSMVMRLQNKSQNLPMLYSSFLVPALAQTILLLATSDEEDEASFYSQHRNDEWLDVLTTKIDDLDDMDITKVWQLSQALFGKPINQLIESEEKRASAPVAGGIDHD